MQEENKNEHKSQSQKEKEALDVPLNLSAAWGVDEAGPKSSGRGTGRDGTKKESVVKQLQQTQQMAAEKLKEEGNFWRQMNANLSKPFNMQNVPIRMTPELTEFKAVGAKYVEKVKNGREEEYTDRGKTLIKDRKVLLGQRTMTNFKLAWKNIPPPIAMIARNYGELLEQIIENLNLLETDFCKSFEASDARFLYHEGIHNQMFETMNKRDNECYLILQKQLNEIATAYPIQLAKQREDILEEVWGPVDVKLSNMNSAIMANVETKLRKHQVQTKNDTKEFFERELAKNTEVNSLIGPGQGCLYKDIHDYLSKFPYEFKNYVKNQSNFSERLNLKFITGDQKQSQLEQLIFEMGNQLEKLTEQNSKFKEEAGFDLEEIKKTVEPLSIYDKHHRDHYLERDESIFLKKVAQTLWKKFDYRINRLEENVFEGSEVSDVPSMMSSKKGGTTSKAKTGEDDFESFKKSTTQKAGGSKPRSEIDSQCIDGAEDDSKTKTSGAPDLSKNLTETLDKQDSMSVRGSDEREKHRTEHIDMVLDLPGASNTVERRRDPPPKTSQTQSVSSKGSNRTRQTGDNKANAVLKMKKLEKKVESQEVIFGEMKLNVASLMKDFETQRQRNEMIIEGLNRDVDNLLKIRRQAEIGERRRVRKQKDALDEYDNAKKFVNESGKKEHATKHLTGKEKCNGHVRNTSYSPPTNIHSNSPRFSMNQPGDSRTVSSMGGNGLGARGMSQSSGGNTSSPLRANLINQNPGYRHDSPDKMLYPGGRESSQLKAQIKSTEKSSKDRLSPNLGQSPRNGTLAYNSFKDAASSFQQQHRTNKDHVRQKLTELSEEIKTPQQMQTVQIQDINSKPQLISDSGVYGNNRDDQQLHLSGSAKLIVQDHLMGQQNAEGGIQNSSDKENSAQRNEFYNMKSTTDISQSQQRYENKTQTSSKVPSLAPKLRQMQNQEINKDLVRDFRQNLNPQSEMAFQKTVQKGPKHPANKWMGHDQVTVETAFSQPNLNSQGGNMRSPNNRGGRPQTGGNNNAKRGLPVKSLMDQRRGTVNLVTNVQTMTGPRAVMAQDIYDARARANSRQLNAISPEPNDSQRSSNTSAALYVQNQQNRNMHCASATQNSRVNNLNMNTLMSQAELTNANQLMGPLNDFQRNLANHRQNTSLPRDNTNTMLNDIAGQMALQTMHPSRRNPTLATEFETIQFFANSRQDHVQHRKLFKSGVISPGVATPSSTINTRSQTRQHIGVLSGQNARSPTTQLRTLNHAVSPTGQDSHSMFHDKFGVGNDAANSSGRGISKTSLGSGKRKKKVKK